MKLDQKGHICNRAKGTMQSGRCDGASAHRQSRLGIPSRDEDRDVCEGEYAVDAKVRCGTRAIVLPTITGALVPSEV